MGRLAPLVVFLAAGIAAEVNAQPKSESTRLFEEGRDLAKAGKFAEACDAFGKSIAIDRAPGTALNYGDCLEHLGQLRKAYQMYDEAAREFDKQGDSRAKFARDRATAVTPKLGTIVVKVATPATPGLVVTIGGESIPPAAEITERYEPGSVEITAKAPGHDPFSRSARAVAGQSVIVEIPAFGGEAHGGGGGPVDTAPLGRRDPTRVKLAIGLGAGGGAALIVGGILALSARSTYHGALDDMLCTHMDGELVCTKDGAGKVDSAATRANVATAFAIGGGALVAAAVVLFVTAPREQLGVAPIASPSTIGFALTRTF